MYRRFKAFVFVFLFASSMILCNHNVLAYEPNSTEMNLYALYLGDGAKGESVLIESKGHALLIDLGDPKQVPSIIQQLRRLKIHKVDILFSHLHKDHMGGTAELPLGGLFQLLNCNIEIGCIYAPSPGLAPQSLIYPQRYSQLAAFAKNHCRLVFLDLGSQITCGDVCGKVIGPLKTGQLNRMDYATNSDYDNNCCLATVFTCGKTRFFTAGDCYEDEANELVEAYGSRLKCDIMKLSHHGTGTGNTKELLSAIAPRYSFAQNTALTGKNSTIGEYHVYPATSLALQYGMCYLTGNEKRTLIFHVVNDQISLYQGNKISYNTRMIGWQSLYGGDGKIIKKITYYITAEGIPLTGIEALEALQKSGY